MSVQTAFCGERIVGYYPSWNRYTTPAEKVRYQDLTHICHAFIWPKSDGTLDLYSDLLDPKLNATAKSAGVRMIVSAGGWGQSDGFATMAANNAARSAFITNIVAFMQKNDYQGLDLDWEYPENSTQRSHFTRLVRELRAAFDNIDSTWSLSFVVPSGSYSASKFEFNALIPLVDWIGCMTYDMHGEWTAHAGHNSPLFAPANEPEGSIDLSIKYLLQQGWPRDKVLVGVPFYGKLFSASQLYGASTGGTAYTYKDIVTMTRGWTYHWDELSQVPYYQNLERTKLITFDDTVSVRKKAEYVHAQGLGGVIVWAVGQDNLGAQQPLLQALAKAMRSSPSGIENEEPFQQPEQAALLKCYPNPFNESAQVEFYLAKEGAVVLRVYSVDGRMVQEIHPGYLPSGWHHMPLHLHDLSSGVYLLQLHSNERMRRLKVTLIR